MPKQEPVKVRVTKIMTVITPKAKYTNHPFRYAIPESVKSRQPVTGQEDVIQWILERVPHPLGGETLVYKSSKSNVADLKPTDLRDLHMGRNPYIINPNDHIVVVHGRSYDNSYDSLIENKDGVDVEVDREYINPKDHAEITALLAGTESNIARSKAEYNNKKHDFYVDDKELEAEKAIDQIDLEFEAAEFVRKEIGSGRYKELLIFLGHAIQEYNVNSDNLSVARVKYLVFKAAKEHPAEVLKMKGPGAARIIFVSKVISSKIIARKKNNDFYYDDIWIGSNFDAVVEWMEDRKNSSIVTKWQNMLDYKERKEQGKPALELEKEKVNA